MSSTRSLSASSWHKRHGERHTSDLVARSSSNGESTVATALDSSDAHVLSPLALSLVLVASFMVVLDFSIVNVALPSIRSSLGFTGDSVQWVVTAYAITFAGLLILGGRVADLFGRR